MRFSKTKMKNQKGVSLMETILVVALIILILSTTAPVYFSYHTRNNLYIISTMVAKYLRQAQAMSFAMIHDDAWSLRIENSRIVIYKGNDFTARDMSFDVVYDLPQNVDITGSNDIQYTKYYGEIDSVKNFTLTNSANQTIDFTVNTKGMIDY